MAWRIKKEDPVETKVEPEIEKSTTESLEDLELEEQKIQEKLKRLNEKKVEVQASKNENPSGQISKQEIIDIIEGNLARTGQLVELLRRM